MQIDPRWDVVEERFDPERAGHYESLFTLANGFLGTRGATEEGYLVRTPGTYLAGFFEKAPRQVIELPNLPDWVRVELAFAGERFDLTQGTILDYRRVLHMRQGVLIREVRWQSPSGKVTKLRFTRFVSLANRRLAGLRIEICPENYSGLGIIRSFIDGQVTNSGTQHFAPVEINTFGERGMYLLSEGNYSKRLLAQAADHTVVGKINQEGFQSDARRVAYWAEVELVPGEWVKLEKVVATASQRETAHDPLEAAVQALEGQGGFDACLAAHIAEWDKLWEQADILIEGPDFDQLAVRFAVFHLMQVAPHNDYTVSIAAKALSGEGYKGHVFWDTEIFMLPFFIYSFPETARGLLRYRHHTLPGAMAKAKDAGYQGAMFAWESADTGEETTPTVGGIDFKTKKPIPILTGQLQQHITADIAYAVGHYVKATGDREFLRRYGAEVVLLGARFWASRVELNPETGQYEINGVIGPDEYKENVNNNYYTNRLAKEQLLYAAQLFTEFQEEEFITRWNFTAEEAKWWQEIACRIALPADGDLLLQCDGFKELAEIDVLKYRGTPGKLQMEYSWEEIKRSQVIKQADVIMLMYLLGSEYTQEQKLRNWEFYEPRTIHDSSLSAAIHSAFACDIGLEHEAYRYFSKAARIDLGDEMANSAHGLHAAALGGLWQAVFHGFAGIRLAADGLSIKPALPKEWERLELKLWYKGAQLSLTCTPAGGKVELLTAAQVVAVELPTGTAVLNEASPAALF